MPGDIANCIPHCNITDTNFTFLVYYIDVTIKKLSFVCVYWIWNPIDTYNI